MSQISLFMLGLPRFEFDGQPIEINRRKAQALFVYLAVNRHPHSRDAMAAVFYPDHPQSRARAYLRRDLAVINTTLLSDWLNVDRDTIELVAVDEIWVDVQQFRSLIQSTRQHDHPAHEPCPTCTANLSQAIALYVEDFLSGFTLRDCPAFDEWQFFQTESLRQDLAWALEQLAHRLIAQNQPGEAIPYARRWISLDPLHEPAQRTLIHLYDQAGQPSAAMRQYEEYVALLESEIGVPPEDETITIYEAVKAKRLLGSILKAEQPPPKSRQSPPPIPPPVVETAAADSVDRLKMPPTVAGPPSLFVGRAQELHQLDAWLQEAAAGRGRVGFVCGDAGQGKTALLQAFSHQAQAAYPELIVAGGNCSAYTGLGDPYLPFREIMELLTGDVEAQVAAGTLRQEQAQRLWQLLPETVQALLAVGPDLLNTFIPNKALLNRAAMQAQGSALWFSELRSLVNRPPGEMRQSYLFEQYAKVLRHLSQKFLLLLFLDDLQWADSGSMNLLFHLARRLPGCRILIVGAYRATEVASGRGDERHPLEKVLNELQQEFGSIVLDLSRAEGRAFVDAWLDSEPNQFDEAFRQKLYQQTEGHPLFTVELLRHLQAQAEIIPNEAGEWIAQPGMNWDSLPVRVEGAIGERIGRLSMPLRELLQVASIEGEEFTAEVAAQTLERADRTVVRQLSHELDKTHRLVQVLGIKQVGGKRLSRYRFRHILIQRYLYNSLDEIEKSHLNETVGNALEALYAGQTEPIAVQLARYFQEAGDLEKAVVYLLQAGLHARRLSANEEAITHLTQALTLLEKLPDTDERAQQELEVRVTLGPALMLIKGHSAPEVEQTYQRAYELSRRVPESAQLFPALWGLWRFYENRGNLQVSHNIGNQCLMLAEAQDNSEFLVAAHIALGTTLLFLGQFGAAHRHFIQVKALYDPAQHRSLPMLYGGFEPTVYRLCYEAYLLWMQGYSDQSRQRSDETLSLAQRLSSPYSLVYALSHSAIHFQFRQDGAAVHRLAAEAVILAREQGFSTFVGAALVLAGWAAVQQGQPAGLNQLRQGLAVYQNVSFLPYFHALWADACLTLGQIDEGLAALAEAMTLLENTDEQFWAAEIYRLKGELLLQKQTTAGESAAAESPEACFLQAIDLAHSQQASVLELRAAVSLGRLWHTQGRTAEARQRLEALYGRFSEGFESVDLQTAAAMIKALGGEGVSHHDQSSPF